MKPKEVNKKLVLNKKTITDLNNQQMDQVKGGLPWTVTCTSNCTHVTACSCFTVCMDDDLPTYTYPDYCNTRDNNCVTDTCTATYCTTDAPDKTILF